MEGLRTQGVRLPRCAQVTALRAWRAAAGDGDSRAQAAARVWGRIGGEKKLAAMEAAVRAAAVQADMRRMRECARRWLTPSGLAWTRTRGAMVGEGRQVRSEELVALIREGGGAVDPAAWKRVKVGPLRYGDYVLVDGETWVPDATCEAWHTCGRERVAARRVLPRLAGPVRVTPQALAAERVQAVEARAAGVMARVRAGVTWVRPGWAAGEDLIGESRAAVRGVVSAVAAARAQGAEVVRRAHGRGDVVVCVAAHWCEADGGGAWFVDRVDRVVEGGLSWGGGALAVAYACLAGGAAVEAHVRVASNSRSLRAHLRAGLRWLHARAAHLSGMGWVHGGGAAGLGDAAGELDAGAAAASGGGVDHARTGRGAGNGLEGLGRGVCTS